MGALASAIVRSPVPTRHASRVLLLTCGVLTAASSPCLAQDRPPAAAASVALGSAVSHGQGLVGPTLPAGRRARGFTQDGPATQDDAKKPEKVGFEWDEGLKLRLGRHGRVDFRLRLQGDLRESDGLMGEGDEAALDLDRRRVAVEGELFDALEFQIERELSGDEPWRDVYVNVRPVTAAQIQAGHFRLPFSLDQNTGATNLDFVYRSQAARLLSPGRDTGVMAHGRLLPRRLLRYEFGAFNHDGRNARLGPTSPRVYGGTTLAGRLAVQPWRGEKSPLEDLHVGAAFTSSEVPLGLPAIRPESVLNAVLDRPDTPVLGPRRRLGVEGRWRPGPFSVKAEYIRVETAREGQSVEDTDLSPLVGAGWYVSGTWAITGERKSRGLSSPKRPIHEKGPGAIELAFRVEGIALRSKAEGEPSNSPRADVVPPVEEQVVTAGVNWYLNRYLKVQANVVRERFANPAQSTRPGQPVVWSQLLRVQLTL